MASELWLVRHGETEWTISGAHTGRTDIPLTGRGAEQAALLGRCLAAQPFALVLTSPLRRARDTCALAGYGEAAQIEPDLREWDYGEYEGRSTPEIRRERPGWSLWSDATPGGETVEQVAARARRVLHRAAAVDGVVALFGHGHHLRVLTACWLGLPPAAGQRFSLSTASISVLGYYREIQVLERWNVRCA